VRVYIGDVASREGKGGWHEGVDGSDDEEEVKTCSNLSSCTAIATRKIAYSIRPIRN